MAVTTVWAAVIIIYGVFTGIAMVSASDIFPLDMAPNSVDDMYRGCKDKMRHKVKSEFLLNEKTTNKLFKKAWDEAESNYKQGTGPLGKEQVMAIVAYTQERQRIYSDLNQSVRDQRFIYRTEFEYHALHFYLTDAIQTLRVHSGKKCYDVRRRTKLSFSQDVFGKKIRFGSFTSSTLGRWNNIQNFGDKSCFEIRTCYGADITDYSQFEYEKEVLIPPYEVFKVTKITTKRYKTENLPCDVVYTVKSTGKPLSNLNCALFSFFQKCLNCG